MFRATMKSLLSRKLRLGLSALSVVLGVMFVSGAFVLTDTIGKSFDGLFTDAYSNIDIQVTRAPRDTQDAQNPLFDKPIPAHIVDEVRAVDGVSKARGSVFMDGARVLNRTTGKPLSSGFGAPNYGGNWAEDDILVHIRKGRSPKSDDEVVISGNIASAGKFAVGDSISVRFPPRDDQESKNVTFTISGICEYTGGRDSLGGEMTTFFTTATAQRLLLSGQNVFTDITVTTSATQTDTVVRDRIRQRIGSEYRVKTGKETAKEASNQVKKALTFVNYILLGFAGISLFVGIFLILNTFSIIIAQRMRELALMRAIGASRQQILGSVLLEALAIGLIASILGLAAGVGVGALLAQLFDMSGEGVGVPASAVISSFAVGILVTTIAAMVPAFRASKIPPIAALQESATPDRPLTRLTIGGLFVTTLGAIALGIGLLGKAGDTTLWTILIGVMVTFIGIALLTPIISRPIVGILGKIFARSIPGELGRRNTARNPRRTAITAAALMVGIAIITAVSTILSSATTSMEKVFDSTLRAHLIVSGVQVSQIPPTLSSTVVDQIRHISQVEAVGAVWMEPATRNNNQEYLQATDDLPALLSMYGASMTEGTPSQLGTGQAVIDSKTAKKDGLSVGSTIRLRFTRGEERIFTIVGIYRHSSVAEGTIVSSQEKKDFQTPEPQLALVKVTNESDISTVRANVEHLLANNPDMSVTDRSGYIKQQSGMLDTILNYIQILLALAMVIAVLGVINTLILCVIERTRELGLLRAVGLNRFQTIKMIMVESVVISLFGALLGVTVGAGLGATTVRALKDKGFTTIDLPLERMLAYLILAGIVGVIAAIIPAIRAARLNVLSAIAHE